MRNSKSWPFGWVRTLFAVGAALGVAVSVSGCVNLYGGLDHPSGDAQLISAARGCLDSGDYQCALSDYQQLSSSNADIDNSESAYTVFTQDGAGMAAFAIAFGDGKTANIGVGFTNMANAIIAQASPGATARTNIYNAFMKYQSITDNTDLSALVEFLGATAFASEILAEMSDGQSTLTCADLSTSNAVASCSGSGGPLGTCMSTGNASCPVNTTSNYTSSNIQSGNSGNGTLDMFNAAVLNIDDGIFRLGGSGSFTKSFTSVFTTLGLVSAGACSGQTNTVYIAALRGIGVGGCP